MLHRLDELINTLNPHSIHTFLPIKRNREPDVFPLFKKWWGDNRSIIVSSTDFKTRVMTHYRLEQSTILEENKLGIPEPVNAKPVTDYSTAVILVPLIVADKSLNRIGYGGGFYDQLLESSSARKIGLSLGSPLDDLLQQEEWDIRLDQLVNPSGIY